MLPFCPCHIVNDLMVLIDACTITLPTNLHHLPVLDTVLRWAVGGMADPFCRVRD